MKPLTLSAASFVAVAGLALFAAASSAEEPQAPGSVRITDAVRPTSGFFPVSDAETAAVPMPPAPPAYAAPGAGHSGCGPYAMGGWPGNDCPPGEVIWEGRPHRMTGIGPVDWMTTCRMKCHGHMAAGWHKFWWSVCHRHKECETECPPPAGHGVYGCPPGGGYGCPPSGCHPQKCGPHGCGPHCALHAHGWPGHGAHDPGRFGYLQPAGIESHGHYSAAYPVNPWHFDQRDGRIYAAEGYGVPMAVPLAPNVEHTYNYGWGIPSSRLTPVSHMPPDSRGFPHR
ncbi:MAG: hypothetical protein WD069_14185 [Planctomycetales bacterium]